MPSYTDGAWHYNVNDNFPTSEERLVSFANTLLAAGWTVVDRSDGSTVIIGGQNSVADWGNNFAWERYRQPDGQRDLTLQRSTGANVARSFYGRAGILFTGGTATVPPSDASQTQIIGSGNGYDASFFNTGRYQHFSAKATPDGATADVYAFSFVNRTIGAPTADLTSVYLDAVDSPAGAADVEPWVFARAMSSPATFTGWYMAGLAGEALQTGIQKYYVAGTTITAWSGQNPYILEDDVPAIFAVTTSGFLQRKGQLSNYIAPSRIRAAGDTLNLATPGAARVNWISGSDGYALPWPSGVTPAI